MEFLPLLMLMDYYFSVLERDEQTRNKTSANLQNFLRNSRLISTKLDQESWNLKSLAKNFAEPQFLGQKIYDKFQLALPW